jgi:hypothetical protein
VTTRPPDDRERDSRTRKDARGFSLPWFSNHQYRSAIALLAGLLVAVAVAVYLWTSDGGSDRAATAAPERGVACPALHNAFEQRQAGNEAAFRRSVDEAARAGEQALDRSGQVFGEPEEIAITLQYALAEEAGGDQAGSYLAQAQKACERLGRWGGGS